MKSQTISACREKPTADPIRPRAEKSPLVEGVGVEELCDECSDIDSQEGRDVRDVRNGVEVGSKNVLCEVRLTASHLLLCHVKGATVSVRTRTDDTAQANVLAVHCASPHASDVDYGGGRD